MENNFLRLFFTLVTLSRFVAFKDLYFFWPLTITVRDRVTWARLFYVLRALRCILYG